MKSGKVVLIVLLLMALLAMISFANHEVSSFQVTLPPGGFYAFSYNTTSGLLSVPSTGVNFLPSCARMALKITPPLWKDKLAETFHLLMKSDVNVGKNSFPAFADLNGDGLVDMVVGSRTNGIEIFYNEGSKFNPVWVKENTFDFFAKTPSGTDLAVALGDINGDGLTDLVTVDEAGKISFYINKGTKNKPYWVLSNYTIKRIGKNDVPRLVDLNGNGRKDLVLGGGNGQIYFYANEATSTKLGFEFVPQKSGEAGYDGFFSKWPKPNGTTGIMVGNKLAPAFGDLSGNGLPDMIVGNGSGRLFYFENIGTKKDPIWKQMNIPTLDSIKIPGRAVPYIVNLNGDSRPDLVIGSSDGKVYYAFNVGTNSTPAFRVWKSGASSSWMGEYMWSSAYWKDLNNFTYVNPFDKYVKDYANLILSTKPEYVDEVSYIIANSFPENLEKMDNKGLTGIYERIPEAISKNASELKYVKIVNQGIYTTLKYRSKDGKWLILPKEIYYKYVIMPDRYMFFFPGTSPTYKGEIFSEYLPYNKMYGKSLMSVVKDATNVTVAVHDIARWLVDLGARWHTGPKPRGWYNIYRNLLNKKAGIWCGEFSIIVEAMGRSVLIPTTIIVDLGEDHQFNQYYDNGWNHWDQSSMNKKNWRTYIGNKNLPKTWYGYYKGHFSWPMEWEQDGRYDYVHHTNVLYKATNLTASISVKVTDAKGVPIDGAQIVVWSHWPLKHHYDNMPYPAAITYTDQNGEARINDLAIRTYTISVVTPVGVKYITTKLDKHAMYSFNVKMSEALPVYEPNYVLPMTPFSTNRLNVRVLNAVQKTINWLYTGGVIYREYKNGKVKVYVVNKENYERFLKGEKFEAYSVSDIHSGIAKLPPNVYVILSNLESAHTYVKVNVSLDKH